MQDFFVVRLQTAVHLFDKVLLHIIHNLFTIIYSTFIYSTFASLSLLEL